MPGFQPPASCAFMETKLAVTGFGYSVAAHVLLITNHGETDETGAPVVVGQVQEVVRCSVMVPDEPGGQEVFRVSVVEAGAEQVAAQVLTTLRTAPVSAQSLQSPTVGAGSAVVPAGHWVAISRVLTCSASQVILPVSPEGQTSWRASHWICVSVSTSVGQVSHVGLPSRSRYGCHADQVDDSVVAFTQPRKRICGVPGP